MKSKPEAAIPLISVNRTRVDDVVGAKPNSTSQDAIMASGSELAATRLRGEMPQTPANRALRTRNACVVALGFGWCAALASFVYGVVLLASDNPFAAQCHGHHSDATAEELARLATISAVTALVESAGYVHAVSLRWTLQHEGRLQFSSNLRLFSSSRSVMPNRWYVNFIAALCTIVAYASASLAIFGANISNPDYTGPDNSLGYTTCTAGLPMILLGLSLAGVAGIGTWCLWVPNILTWSSSPLDVALATTGLGQASRRPGRCMLGVQDLLQPTAPEKPRLKQCSASQARNNVKSLLYILLALGAVCCAWIGVVHALINQQGWGGWWNFFPEDASTFTTTWTSDQGGGSTRLQVFRLFAIYAAIQSPITLSLHTAELVANLSRDEMYWRRATSNKGCDLRSYKTVVAALTSWQSVTLYLFKALLHWLFGLGFGLPQTVWFTMAFAVFSLAVLWIALSRPTGPQPAAYGHLQTLLDLIDEWSTTIYWGHKESTESGIAHAGTSHSRLPQVDVDTYYSGTK